MPVRTCGNCGAPARLPFLAPPPETAPDLDGRPGEPARASLHRWVQVCPACHAAAPDLAQLRPGRVAESPDPTDPFERWAMTAEMHDAGRSAAEAWLWAAWAADDAGDDAAARARRQRAGTCWGEPAGPADAMRLADVLRRAGDFARAEAVLARARPGEEGEAAVHAYLTGLVAAQDGARHLLSSALRPPARRPHVSHVPARQRGFWQRITGR